MFLIILFDIEFMSRIKISNENIFSKKIQR